MTARRMLLKAPPYEIEANLKRLGANLRIARLRRNMTVQEVAKKIGTGTRAVLDAEKGKPSTGIAVYLALLWAFDLLRPFEKLADPNTDETGRLLALSKERSRASRKRRLDNDF